MVVGKTMSILQTVFAVRCSLKHSKNFNMLNIIMPQEYDFVKVGSIFDQQRDSKSWTILELQKHKE